jgi:hypothetical protein
MKHSSVIYTLVLVFLSFAGAPRAEAGSCRHRLGIGAGVVHLDTPNETDFEVGAEYECRMDSILGVGGFVDYIFSNPGITLIGVPQMYLHPFGGDFYLAASPLLETGSAVGTHVGARLSTRVPIPIGSIAIVPSFAVDFINGGNIYWFGLGIAI